MPLAKGIAKAQAVIGRSFSRKVVTQREQCPCITGNADIVIAGDRSATFHINRKLS
jgi:hypothetical protein